MNTTAKLKTSLRLILMPLLFSLLFSCGPAEIDSKEQALEQLGTIIEKEVPYGQRENNYRANIQLSQTNLLSILPNINEYPMTLDSRDSSTVEACLLYTSPSPRDRG